MYIKPITGLLMAVVDPDALLPMKNITLGQILLNGSLTCAAI